MALTERPSSTAYDHLQVWRRLERHLEELAPQDPRRPEIQAQLECARRDYLTTFDELTEQSEGEGRKELA